MTAYFPFLPIKSPLSGFVTFNTVVVSARLKFGVTEKYKSESCTSTESVPVFLVIISAVDSKLSVDAALVSSFIFQRCDEIPSAYSKLNLRVSATR